MVSLLLVLIVGGILLLAYFVPTLVAAKREHRNLAAITALNFFAGWTFVGWIVALVWALTKDRIEEVRPS